MCGEAGRFWKRFTLTLFSERFLQFTGSQASQWLITRVSDFGNTGLLSRFGLSQPDSIKESRIITKLSCLLWQSKRLDERVILILQLLLKRLAERSSELTGKDLWACSTRIFPGRTNPNCDGIQIRYREFIMRLRITGRAIWICEPLIHYNPCYCR